MRAVLLLATGAAPASNPLSRSALYLVSGLLRRLASLLLLPFLLLCLTPAEFTRYGLLASALALLVPCLSLNAHLAPTRLFFDHESPAKRSNLLLSALFTAAVSALFGLALLLLALLAGGWWDPISDGAWDLRLLLAGAVICSIVAEFGIADRKIRGEARAVTLTETLQGFSLLGFFLLLRPLAPDPIFALALAYLLSAGLAAGIGLWYSRPHLLAGRFDPGAAARSLRFSGPTVVHVAALWGVASSGRWIGAAHMPLERLATYTLLTLAIGVVGLVSRALFEAYLPEIGGAFGRGLYRQGSRLIDRVTLLAGGLTVALYLVGWMALPLFDRVAPPAYRFGPGLLGLAAAASLGDLVYLRGLQTLIALKRPALQALSTVVSGLLTVALALLLVRRLGATGLLLATASGFFLQAVGSSAIARRQLRLARRGAGEGLAGRRGER